MGFDSHCHLDFGAFDADRELVVARAQAVGVERVFVPGVSQSQWAALPVLREQFPGICVGVGMHPGFLPEESELGMQLERLEAACIQVGAVAVGETGLDQLVAKRGGSPLELQRRAFEVHLVVAKLLGLPLVLHVVRAHGAALETLRHHAPFPAGGVLHSYSGPAELVRSYAELGFSFSFSGAVTRPAARRMHEAARIVAPDRLLLETDAPDQRPEGFERKRNEPSALPLIAAAVATLRNTQPTALLELTAANAARLYSV